MAGVNKAIIVGRLGQDPEIRYFQDGSAVANFSVATSEEWKDKETGEKRERTEWHRIVAYRRLAEICGQYLSKGRQVYIEGRIQTREWDDRDGNKRYTTEIVANIMQMLGSRADAGAGAPGGYNRPPQGNQANQGGGYPGGSNPGGGGFPGGPMGGEPQAPTTPAEKGYPDDGGVKGTPQPDPGPDDDDIPF